MPPILSKPSKAAHLAIGFVTLGALLMVWSTVWWVWMYNHQPHPPADSTQPHNDSGFYWCALVFFSGLTLFIIGFALGRIGRAARRAELPPEVSAAATAQPAVTAPQPVMMNGQPVAAPQPVIPGQPVVGMQPVPPVAQVANTAPTAPVR